MDLNEIEREADLLADKLVLEATGRNEAMLLGIQIEGLKDLATIKAVRDSRAEHNVAVDLRQRELAAMEQVAANMPTQYPMPELPQCGHRWSWSEPFGRDFRQLHHEICTLSPDHAGSHRNAVTGVSAVVTELAGGLEYLPTPAVKKLRELVTYCTTMYAENESGDAAEAYEDVRNQLQEILQGGGLL